MKMYDNYSPLHLLTKPFSSPIFQYEINHLRWKPEFEDIRGADWAHVGLIFKYQVLIIIGLLAVSSVSPTVGTILAVATGYVIGVAPFIYTVIVDLRTVSTTIAFWHNHNQGIGLDVLRLTMPSDSDLLTMLRAAAELTVWRGMRWEMGLRGYLVVYGIMVTVFFGIIMILFSNAITIWTAVLIPYWVIRLLMLFAYEPLWRMRALVALSIAAAARVPDTNAAILTASAMALCLKVAQLALIVVLILFTLNLMVMRMDQATQFLLLPIWLLGNGLLTTRLVRRIYGALHALCTWLTLRTLQGADDFMPFAVPLYNEREGHEMV